MLGHLWWSLWLIGRRLPEIQKCWINLCRVLISLSLILIKSTVVRDSSIILAKKDIIVLNRCIRRHLECRILEINSKECPQCKTSSIHRSIQWIHTIHRISKWMISRIPKAQKWEEWWQKGLTTNSPQSLLRWVTISTISWVKNNRMVNSSTMWFN